jgi:murein endopeptidase
MIPMQTGPSIDTAVGLKAAIRRAQVRLDDGCTAVLCYWPVPEHERIIEAEPRVNPQRRPAQAKVLMGGRYHKVPPHRIIEIVD